MEQTAQYKISSSNKAFYPEIESLRAIAVIMVLMAHFLPSKGSYHIPYMYYGVDLFFTISGFLITSILLNNKYKQHKASKHIIKNFYIRRALRLFPIYYLFVIFFWASYNFGNLHMWKNEYNIYFFTYFQNIYFYKIGALNNYFSHLWSLGVEEQFYIIWPFLIIFLNRKTLPYILITIILSSIIVNSIFFHIPVFRNLTYANLHTLGIGALFAYYHTTNNQNALFTYIIKHRTLLSIISLIIFIIILKTSIGNIYIQTFLKELFLALTCLSFVLTSTYGWQNIFSKIMQFKPIMHIGKISYGIYLYHYPIPFLLNVLSKKYLNTSLTFNNSIISFLTYTCITFIIAHFSYKIIETPILKLKEKFI